MIYIIITTISTLPSSQSCVEAVCLWAHVPATDVSAKSVSANRDLELSESHQGIPAYTTGKVLPAVDF